MDRSIVDLLGGAQLPSRMFGVVTKHEPELADSTDVLGCDCRWTGYR